MSFSTNPYRKKLIFLGTPDVAADVLQFIFQRIGTFVQIVAVVSQPPARSKRSNKLQPSPVHALAERLGIPVLTPTSAKDDEFLDAVSKLQPDLCLTAAYGNFLPKVFLDIPKYGTINIHPSLLPRYRGASPVQRAIENGDTETGVTLLFSILKMDAGPIFLQEKYPINQNIKSSELLKVLFLKGASLFVRHYQKIFSPNCIVHEQDSSKATQAQKIEKEERWLDFRKSAQICHNKVRAFDIWPKTMGKFLIDGIQKELKIISTEVCENTHGLKQNEVFVNFATNSIDICCGENSILRVTELQEVNKRAMTAKEYINGLHGRKIICV